MDETWKQLLKIVATVVNNESHLIWEGLIRRNGHLPDLVINQNFFEFKLGSSDIHLKSDIDVCMSGNRDID